MKFIKENFSKILTACVLIIIGILCIIADVASAEASLDAYKGISITIGVVFIVLSSIVIIFALIGSIMDKTSILLSLIPNALLLGAGIFFVSNDTVAGSLILYFLALIPFLLLALGGFILVDAILNLVFAIINKQVNKVLPLIIVEFVISAITVALGALTIGTDPVIKKQLLIFGIIVVLFGAYTFANCFIKTKTVVLIKNEK